MYPLRVGKEMKAQGHKVYGISFHQSSIAEAMTEQFDGFKGIHSRGEGYRCLFQLANFIKQNQIQYVHCHKSSDLALAVLLKKLCGFKLVYTDHMGVKKPKKDLFHRYIYRNVDQVLSISQFTLAHNKRALPVSEGAIQALWLGTDIPELPFTQEKSGLKDELGVSADTFVVGIVGRLSPGKGHLELLKAIQQLGNRFHLVIVGGMNAKQGGDEDYIAMLQSFVSQHSLSKQVTFYGFSTTPEVLLAGMDVVAIPSHLEAFGLTVIEAMARGKAIVGSDAGAIPEILANTGLLANPFDTDEFAKAIQALCEDAIKRATLERAAFERAKHTFNQTVHVEKLLNVYQQL
ncbi:glycosyltransferase family 4 protein [Marinomonas ostreistagni]|uniref:Glycosyltransferase family 4 protein n=2 Tax=Marinomonas ostreistagni TaxID=359209 RepID=A0ABS0Z6F2_9GAMM|nr:glycosyltransferase family 4 protein [Marinomonas ostreistagni]